MPDFDLGTARGKVVIDSDQAVTGFGKATDAQTKFTKGAKVSGAVIGGAGIAIAAGLGFAINSAANFEERMSAINAVSGASKTQFEALRKKALQLGADTKFSATEAASAIEELVKAGVPIEDVLNGAADAAVNLAAAGEVDLATAATIASNALNVFNLRGRDMPHVADLIAGAANASAIDVTDFGQSLQQAGATANLVGLSFDDLTVAIAAMGNAGIKGSDAGTSLKTFLSNLQPVTKKQTELFKKLGLITKDGGNQFFDAAGKIKPMRDIAETLSKALAGQTEQQKALTLETLFGSDAIRAAAIIADEGGKGFDKLSGAIHKVSAEDVAQKRMDNLRGAIEQLKGSLETVAIQIGDAFLPILRKVAEFLTKAANAFGNLSPSMQKMIAISAAVAAAILVVVGSALLLVGWLGSIAAAVGLTIGALLTVVGVAALVIVAIIALVAAIVLLWKKNEGFRNVVKATWSFIKDTVLKIIDNIKNGIAGLIAAFKGEGITSDGFVGAMERIGVAARAVVTFFQDKVIPAIQFLAREFMERLGSASKWVQDNVFPVFAAFGDLILAVVKVVMGAIHVLTPLFQGVFNGIVITVKTAINIIKTIIEGFVKIVIIIWNNFGHVIFDALKVAFNLIVGLVRGALQIVKGIIEVVTGLITLNWSKVWQGIKDILGGNLTIIKSIVQAAMGFIKVIIEAAIGLIKTIWQAGWVFIQTIVKVAWDLIKGFIGTALSVIKGIIGSFIQLVKNAWNAFWGVIRNATVSAWNAVKNATTSAVGAVISFIRGLPGKAAGALSSFASTLFNIAKNAFNSMKNAVTSGISGVIDLIKSIPGKVVKALGDMGRVLLDAGKKLIGGFIDGIKSKIPDVGGALGAITKHLPSWKGPPNKDKKILIPVGELVLSGFIRGIQNQIIPLRKLLGSIGPDMQGHIATGFGTVPRGFGGAGTTTVSPTITFNFPGVRSAEDAKEIERELSTSQVLDKLVHATRAGVGAR